MTTCKKCWPDASIEAGHRYTRPDGSRVRVDSVEKGEVHFVSWKPGQDVGCSIRMLIADFKIAIRIERMKLYERIGGSFFEGSM